MWTGLLLSRLRRRETIALMADLSRLTSRDAVLAAMAESDELGRDQFLDKYGFGKSQTYFVVFEGKRYDSKPILAAAWGNQFPDEGPLAYKAVHGGKLTTTPLERLGFTIESTSATDHPVDPALDARDAPQSALRAHMDLNTIYFGPPGTGKTYKTASRAVEIIDGKVSDDRNEAMARYSQLRETGQVELVTFHQSYSYEEFVEGIRPTLSDEEETEPGEVGYECLKGVFRRICERAQGQGAPMRRRSIELDPTAHVWKISLGNTKKAGQEWIFDDALENNRIILGWGGRLDYSGCDTVDDITNKQHAEPAHGKSSPYSARAVDTLKNKMAVGDLVVISDGNRKFRAIGRIAGGYEHLDRELYAQSRPVDWLFVPEDSLPHDDLLNKVFSQATIYELKPNVLKQEALRHLLADEPPASGPSKHVLIIDEINRGNIAKILGELITLLEPDKRVGAENELRATLPYSGDSFGVPSNLYVIGTMNTADRSIALLDTALRRRFRFEEMMPDQAVIATVLESDGVIADVDIPKLVVTLNQRIELLYDRDHTLGHAFFLKVKTLGDLREVFVYKIIPLLQEYFYDDWEKIDLVLGCGLGDGGKKNAHALLSATTLDADSLGISADIEGKTSYQISPDFLSAAAAELAPFFQAITTSAATD